MKKTAVSLFKSLRANVDKKRKYNAKVRVISGYKDLPRYLDVGGGHFVRNNWRILDYASSHYNYDKVFIDYNINLETLKEWPIEDASYDLVYTSHTLEHLSDEAIDFTLKEIRRVLKDSGGLRVVVPDIDTALYHYEQHDIAWFEIIHPGWRGNKGSDDFILERHILDFFASHLPAKGADLPKFRSDFSELKKTAFLNKYKNMLKDEWQSEDYSCHRNWFDYNRLEDLLKKAGFQTILRSECKKSIFTEMCNNDFDNTVPQMSLYVDARPYGMQSEY